MILLCDFSFVLAFPQTISLPVDKSTLKLSNGALINTPLLETIQHTTFQKKYVLSANSLATLNSYSQDIQPPFNELYSTQDIGLAKHEIKLYQKLADQFNVPVTNLLLIDDTEVNVKTATEAGAQGIQFLNNQQIEKEIDKLQISNVK